jgi:lipopolysaccharide biosynthesis glycosyltransferase
MDNPLQSPGTIRILSAANSAFAMPLAVMLVSVAANLDSSRRLVIYVMDSGLSARDRDNIAASLRANRPGFREGDLHWLALDPAQIGQLPVTRHVSADVYSRLLAPGLLPPDCDRVLYLDSDLVALADVASVYDMISDRKIVWAVHDVGIPLVSSPSGVFDYAELGIPATARYFNSGVMGINLKRWRREKVTERVFDYLHRSQGSVDYWDQGGLNAILHDEWAPLDLVWNQTTHSILHPEIWSAAGYARADWGRVRDHAAIIHFSGGDKPWKLRRVNKPRGLFFWRYFDKTVYRGTMRRPYLESLVGYRAYFFLWQKVRRLIYALRGPG